MFRERKAQEEKMKTTSIRKRIARGNRLPNGTAPLLDRTRSAGEKALKAATEQQVAEFVRTFSVRWEW